MMMLWSMVYILVVVSMLVLVVYAAFIYIRLVSIISFLPSIYAYVRVVVHSIAREADLV
jgi:hypothetical protein